MLNFSQKHTKLKTTNEEEDQSIKNLQEAETYLRKNDEWNSVKNMDRQIIINWANFLKNKEGAK